MNQILYAVLYNVIFSLFAVTLMIATKKQKLKYKMISGIFLGVILLIPLYFQIFTFLYLYYFVFVIMFYCLGFLMSSMLMLAILLVQPSLIGYRLIFIVVLTIFCYIFRNSKWYTPKVFHPLSLVIPIFYHIELQPFKLAIQLIFIINALYFGFLWLVINITKKLKQRHTTYMTLKQLALYDPNTHFYSPYYYERYFKGKGFEKSLAVIDIDRVKNYEDIFGYNITNEIVFSFCKILFQDLADICQIIRLEQDRFMLLFTINDPDFCESRLNRFRSKVESLTLDVCDQRIKITISIGLVLNKTLTKIDALFEQAQNALKDAKIHGRNKITVV